MKRMRAVLATVFVALAAMVVAAPAAAESDPAVDEQIVAVMRAMPGGVVVDRYRAVWPATGMEMAVPDPAVPNAVKGCATGMVCAFSSYNATGASLSWSTCGTFPISGFTTRSIADARSSGYAQARNGTTVVATATAGNFANVFSPVTNLRCVP